MLMSVTVQIKRAEHNKDLPLPRQMTQGAAGFDIAAAVGESVVIERGRIVLIPCGFHLAIPPGYEAQVRPRSGLSAKHGITPINSPGTIDADYRGEIFVPLINHGVEAFVIERGMRIAQMVIVPLPRVQLIEVQELDATTRGAGGFGHTGHA